MNIRLTSLRILYALFFLSGFTALLYQVCWQRILLVFSGSDIESATIVISAFLVGLGIGAWIFGKLSDKLNSSQNMFVYALVEFGISALGALSPFIFYDFLYYKSQHFAATPVSTGITLFAFLLLPTMLMGGTLPILSKIICTDTFLAPKKISYLNAFNLLGAALGAICTGWFLIGKLGYRGALYAGSGINFFIGLVFLIYFFQQKRHSNTFTSTVPIHNTSPASFPTSSHLVEWCLLFFGSGFIAISLEIIWFRILDVALESHAYTFSYLLFCFLFFDGIGVLIGIRKSSQLTDYRLTFIKVQMSIVIYSAASISLMTYLSWNKVSQPYLYGYLILTPLLIGPPAMLIGFSFPLIQAALRNDPSGIGARVGFLQTSNILGNALAGSITGLLLLEYVGTSGAIRALILIALLVFLAEMLPSLRIQPSGRQYRTLLTYATPLIVLLTVTPNNSRLWTGGVLKVHDGGSAIIKETSSALNAIITSPQTDWAFVTSNGKGQGSIPYFGSHVALGFIPAITHPKPNKILIIGLGSSGTAFGAGADYRTEKIDVVEISAGNLSLIRDYLADNNYTNYIRMFTDPRYNFIEGDGRKYISHINERYDVIELDAIQPDRSGSGLLYSIEFFRQLSAKLSDDGIVAMWLPTNRSKNTFIKAFPYGMSGSLFYIGSNRPIRQDMEKLLHDETIQHLSAYLQTPRAELQEILKSYAADEKIFYWEPGNLPQNLNLGNDINTDLFPKDEFSLHNPDI